MQIVFEPEHFRSAAYDGETRVGVAELEEARGCWVITHTEVDPAYGGQGIARRLIEEIIAEARHTGKKIVPVCSYAEKMMRGREEYTDVLADRVESVRQKGTVAKFSNFVQQSRELTEIHIICIGCCVYAFRDER